MINYSSDYQVLINHEEIWYLSLSLILLHAFVRYSKFFSLDFVFEVQNGG